MNRNATMTTWIGVVSVAFFTTASTPALAANDDTEGIYKGTVQKVDLTNNKVDVLKGTTTKTFLVDKSTSILTKEKPRGAVLKDLRSGFNVEIAYTQEGGSAMATSIKETDKRAPLESLKGKPIPPAPAPSSR